MSPDRQNIERLRQIAEGMDNLDDYCAIRECASAYEALVDDTERAEEKG